ncbi:hypothetical protein [Gorillibacterium sp. CAU 1737]|uniref:hypothetical protein n=1 Tax=Gorillibacterium sp. CAU 1737 TaxID=3140362 RepID=UPI003260A392
MIKSKLSDEVMQRSSLRVNGTDEQGNYVVTQSNSATTEVMEWYHVNPATNEVTCEILADLCLEKEESVASTEPSELTPDQSKALQLAKEYAKQNLGPGYVEDSTFISFDHEEEGKLVFQVYNLGAGGTQTLDWLTVDLDSNKVTGMFKK